MRTIEFFCGTAHLSDVLEYQGHLAHTLDLVQIKNSRKIDYLQDFLEFDYKAFSPAHFDVIFFAIPCTAFSKASGGKHFDKNWQPLTQTAVTSSLIVQRCFEIINYFSQAIFYIENPAGRLVTFPPMAAFVTRSDVHIWRFDLLIFGFPTKKQTDLITNSEIPFLFCPVHRVNGKYQKNKFDNLSLRQRQTYPLAFCEFIANNLKNTPLARGKKPLAERHNTSF